jgi:hypothetical protein
MKKIFFELLTFFILYAIIIFAISFMLLSANGKYIYPTIRHDHDDKTTTINEIEASEDYPYFDIVT